MHATETICKKKHTIFEETNENKKLREKQMHADENGVDNNVCK